MVRLVRIVPPSKQGANGGPSSKGHVSRRDLQQRMARQAAIERAISKYLFLDCGHKSTLQVDEGYSIWRPKKGMTFCENCHDWVVISKPPAPPAIPDTPLF
jgi:hypothetical protein